MLTAGKGGPPATGRSRARLLRVIASGPIIVHQSLPVGDPPTAWLAVAQELVPTATSWAVNSHALCAPINGYELVEESSAFDSTDFKLVFVDCPPGKSPIGGGGGIFFFNPDLALFSQQPTATGWLAGGRESSPVAGNWLVNVKVSCAPAVDLESILSGTNFATGNRDELWLQCNAPRVLIGGGVHSEHAFYGAWPESSIRWQVDGRRISGTAAWTLIGSIVCYLPPLFFDGFESGDTSAWPAP